MYRIRLRIVDNNDTLCSAYVTAQLTANLLQAMSVLVCGQSMVIFHIFKGGILCLRN
jgi:hypothetical protein